METFSKKQSHKRSWLLTSEADFMDISRTHPEMWRLVYINTILKSEGKRDAGKCKEMILVSLTA